MSQEAAASPGADRVADIGVALAASSHVGTLIVDLFLGSHTPAPPVPTTTGS